MWYIQKESRVTQGITISEKKRVQVSFTQEQWEILKELKSSMGNTDAEVVRNIILAWLSEKGIISSYFKSAGSSKIKGELRVDKANIAGSTTVGGDVSLGELDASGSFKVEGKTKAERMDISGSAKFEEDIKSEEFHASGSIIFEGKVEAKIMKVSGTLNAKKPITTEQCIFQGIFNIDALTATEATLRLKGQCFAGRIEGGTLHVKADPSRKGGSLKVNTIEGKEISLENTEAEIVGGERVSIGPGCKINRLRAKKMDIHESSLIQEKQRM